MASTESHKRAYSVDTGAVNQATSSAPAVRPRASSAPAALAGAMPAQHLAAAPATAQGRSGHSADQRDYLANPAVLWPAQQRAIERYAAAGLDADVVVERPESGFPGHRVDAGVVVRAMRVEWRKLRESRRR